MGLTTEGLCASDGNLHDREAQSCRRQRRTEALEQILGVDSLCCCSCPDLKAEPWHQGLDLRLRQRTGGDHLRCFEAFLGKSPESTCLAGEAEHGRSALVAEGIPLLQLLSRGNLRQIKGLFKRYKRVRSHGG